MNASTSMSEQARYRWAVTSRVVAAVLGGYALISALTLLLALVWPLPQAQALMASTMLSFAVYTVVVIWVFAARSLSRIWIGLVAGTLVATLLCLLLRGGAA
jgi:hypothetical protein